MFLEFLKSRIVYCLLVFLHPSLRDSFFRTQCKVHIPYISHESRYRLDQKKVSSRSRLGHSRVSSRSRLGKFGKRLGLVSVSGAQVSVLVSVSTQKVLGPSLLYLNINSQQLSRLQLILNSAARAVTQTPKFHHITPHLKSLHCLKITQRIQYKILSLT